MSYSVGWPGHFRQFLIVSYKWRADEWNREAYNLVKYVRKIIRFDWIALTLIIKLGSWFQDLKQVKWRGLDQLRIIMK